MRFSEVNITPVKPHSGLVAIASVVIDDCLYLNSIAVYTKLDGTYRLLYPQKQVGNRNIDLFHPINHKTSKEIEDAIFKRCIEIFEGRNGNDRYNKASHSL